MKIGIITFHGENNYGAMLQAVALKNVLEQYGTVDLINYSSEKGITPKNSVLTKQNELKKRYISTLMFYICNKSLPVNKSFEPLIRIYKASNFIKKYGSLTTQYTYAELKKNIGSSYDVYVSGSDQIWNPKLTELDPAFFLDFADNNKCKISYASSTGGNTFSNEQIIKIKKYLSSFKYISARELNTAKMLENLTGKEVPHVLDPTLLLNKDEWIRNFNIKKRMDNYVLVYNMQTNAEIFKMAKYIAGLYDLKLYNVRNWFCKKMTIDEKCIDEVFFDADPLDFLELISNAKYVVTDSFHGTAFSVNFNIPFIAIQPNSGASRIESFLNSVDLSDRLIVNFIDLKNIRLEFDYAYANILLEEQRQKSMNYIKNALGLESNLSIG